MKLSYLVTQKICRKENMSKFLIWCFNDTHTIRTEEKTTSEKKAHRIYAKAVKSGLYSSVTLRKESRTHGYAIKSWSKDDGEVIYNIHANKS